MLTQSPPPTLPPTGEGGNRDPGKLGARVTLFYGTLSGSMNGATYPGNFSRKS